jgi:hypothetical protein
VTAKRTEAARRDKMRQGGYSDHSGLYRTKPQRQRSITINPGRRSTQELMTAQQRAVLERRRRVEQHMEDAELAKVTSKVWDQSS